MSSHGWIKLHRQLLDWEWFDDHNAFRLFMYLILKANHKAKKYKGTTVEVGQLLTGRDILAKETGLSVQQIRTSLKKLKSTNEITIESSKKGTVIQVVNYLKYQHQPTEQPKDNQIVTTNKNVKNVKKSVQPLFIEWLEYRINLKKPIILDSTLEKLVKVFNESSEDKVKFVVNNSISNGWVGLFWDKYTEHKQPTNEEKLVENVNRQISMYDISKGKQ